MQCFSFFDLQIFSFVNDFQAAISDVKSFFLELMHVVAAVETLLDCHFFPAVFFIISNNMLLAPGFFYYRGIIEREQFFFCNNSNTWFAYYNCCSFVSKLNS